MTKIAVIDQWICVIINLFYWDSTMGHIPSLITLSCSHGWVSIYLIIHLYLKD